MTLPGRRRGWAQILLTCAILTAVVPLAACGDNDEPAPAQTGQASESSTYPVTVQSCGRHLRFEKAPTRVVAAEETPLEIMVGLGLGDRVVGHSELRDPALPEQRSVIDAVPGTFESGAPPREVMFGLRPDFVFANGYYALDPETGSASADDLRAIGAQSYVAYWCNEKDFDTTTIDDVYDTILTIGQIFGVSDRAQQKVDAMKQKISAVRAEIDNEPPVDVISYFGGEGPLNITGRGLKTRIIEMAGGRNVFGDQPAIIEASREEVATKDADVFLINDSAGGTTSPAAESAEFLFETFPNMKASRDRRYEVLKQIPTTPGWRNAETIEQLAGQLHPDAFP